MSSLPQRLVTTLCTFPLRAVQKSAASSARREKLPSPPAFFIFILFSPRLLGLSRTRRRNEFKVADLASFVRVEVLKCWSEPLTCHHEKQEQLGRQTGQLCPHGAPDYPETPSECPVCGFHVYIMNRKMKTAAFCELQESPDSDVIMHAGGEESWYIAQGTNTQHAHSTHTLLVWVCVHNEALESRLRLIQGFILFIFAQDPSLP